MHALIRYLRRPGPKVLITVVYVVITAAIPLSAAMCPQPVELETIDLINEQRLNAGLAPLAAELRLVEAAVLHSEDMAVNAFFDHIGSDGSTPWQRFARAGYPMIAGAENIAAGYGTPSAVVTGWMNSSGHRANILNRSVKHIGVGYILYSPSPYRSYWTADFGSSSDSGQVIPEFSDVGTQHWARNFIRILACHGITVGCGNGSFCAGEPVTRAQMAVFLAKSLGIQAPDICSGTVFGDVNAETVGGDFCRYIEKLAALGITAGCGNNNYCPDAEVSRAQMAVFITRALGASPGTCTGQIFGDVDAQSVGEGFCGFIEKFGALGITSGCSSGMYCPFDSVTRDQMAVFLTKAFLR